MTAAKTRRVEALVTLMCGDPGTPTRIRPGQTVDLPTGDADALISRGFARAAPVDEPPAPKPAPPPPKETGRPKKPPDGDSHDVG